MKCSLLPKALKLNYGSEQRTCFHKLSISDSYESKKELEEKMMYAIIHARGFQLA